MNRKVSWRAVQVVLMLLLEFVVALALSVFYPIFFMIAFIPLLIAIIYMRRYFHCPHCGKMVFISTLLQAKRSPVRCSKCGNPIEVGTIGES